MITSVQSRTFNIERTTIFIFCFCIGLVTQLNGSALGVLKQDITKRIRERLSGNSRFLIYNYFTARYKRKSPFRD